MSTSTLDKPIARPYMPLEDILRYLRRHQVFLCWTEHGPDLWTCGRKMPQPLRRSIYKHREQLAAMMHQASPKVCPARDLHCFEWVLYRSTGRYVCLLCEAISV